MSLNKVLAIGDLIIDEFTYGEPIGISAETPTVVTRQTESFQLLGGIGCVARHLKAIGCVTSVCHTGQFLSEETACWLSLNETPPVTKRRFFSGSYKVAQFDVIPREIGKADFSIVKREMRKFIPNVVVFSDNSRLGLDQIDRMQLAETGKSILFDAQFSQKQPTYAGLGHRNVVVFMNDKELSLFEHDVERAHREIGCGAIVWKRGELGAVWYDGSEKIGELGVRAKVVDTCGAGDAFIAAFAALYHRCDIRDTLRLANLWAAASVETKGTLVPSNRRDIVEAIHAAPVR